MKKALVYLGLIAIIVSVILEFQIRNYYSLIMIFPFISLWKNRNN